MMKVTVLLTRPPLSTAHLTEAVRVSFMIAALNHEVDFVLIDDGVFILLEQTGGKFGRETLRRMEGTDSIRIRVHAGSFRRLIPEVPLPENYRLIESDELSSIMVSSKVLVF